MVTRNDRKLSWLLFAVLLVSYAYFFQGGGWNPNARLDLTRAVAERGTISIDAYRSNTGDWSEHDGHYFTSKAPGLSFLAVPIWLLTKPLATETSEPEARISLSVRAHLANIAVNALPAATLAVVLFLLLGELGFADRGIRVGSTLTFSLGTLAFPYATAFYGHQLAASLGFLSFALTALATLRADSTRYLFLAGMSAGLSVVVETSCVILVIGLMGCLIGARVPMQRIAGFLLGGVPFAIALAYYQYSAFGSALASSYDFANPAVMYNTDGGLFGWPAPVQFYQLLFSPYRGLFFTSPILILAAVGWPAYYRAHRNLALTCLGVAVAFLAMTAAFAGWHGGTCPGPRYMIPALPFIFLSVVYGWRAHPKIASILAVISVSIMLMITVVGVEIPVHFANPLFDLVLPKLIHGQISVNLAGFHEYLPPANFWETNNFSNWSSYNLGELIWFNSLLSVVPLLAFWVASGFLIVRELRRVRR